LIPLRALVITPITHSHPRHPLQEIKLSAADAAAGKTVRLKAAKFTAVHTITVYVENESGEAVGVQSIALGVKATEGGADVSKIKKVECVPLLSYYCCGRCSGMDTSRRTPTQPTHRRRHEH